MFSCEMCGDALRGYKVTTVLFEEIELCGDCLETLEESGKVLMSSRFVGLKS